MLKEQLVQDNFKLIEKNFFEFQNIDSYKEQKEYKFVIKNTILSLKLMKNLITKISDTKILSILIDKFVEILDNFSIFKNSNVEKGFISNNNYKKKKQFIFIYITIHILFFEYCI